MTIEKREIILALEAEIARESAIIARAARDAREAATHEESKPENDKDTRGLELSYLAGAQAKRVGELEKVTNSLKFMVLRQFSKGDAVDLSALVEVEVDGARLYYFMAPFGGGMRVSACGIEVQVITPHSPVGQALVGKTAGDVAEVRVQQGLREYEIVTVS